MERSLTFKNNKTNNHYIVKRFLFDSFTLMLTVALPEDRINQLKNILSIRNYCFSEMKIFGNSLLIELHFL